jgi:DNA-binding transcriptional LysR family regulator
MKGDGPAFPSEHQLALIAALAEHGGITAAATALRISQPAVTAQVQSAERALGASLFVRTRDGLRPTTAGAAVLAFVHRKDALKRALLAEIAQVGEGLAGTVVVGASTTPAEYYLPAWLAAFRAAHPRVDVRLWIGNSRATVERLTNGLVDVAVIGFRSTAADVTCKPILEENIALFAAAGSRYDRRVIRPEHLSDATFIVREPDSATRACGMRALEKLGITPVQLMSVSTNESVVRLVEAGLGVGILSARAVERGLSDGRLAPVKLRGWRCQRELYLARIRLAPNVLVDRFCGFIT